MFGDDVNTSKLHSRKINGCLVPLGSALASSRSSPVCQLCVF